MSASSVRRLAIVWSLIALAVAPPMISGFMATFAVNRDPFVYSQVAKELLSGRRLYTESWMDKPPLALVAYAIPQLVIPRSYRAVAFFGGICISCTGALYAYSFRGSAPAMLAVALFFALFPMTFWDYLWPSTEVFSNVFVAGNLLLGLAIHRNKCFSLSQCLLVGMLTCLAFHVRQNTVVSLLIPMFSLCQASHTLKRFFCGVTFIVLGGLATWACVLGLVLVMGDLRAYFWNVFIYPREYAAAGSFTEFLYLWWHLWTSPLSIIIALFACLAACRRQDLFLVAIVIAVGLFSASCAMRTHYHYWVGSFPYIALLVGLGTQRANESAARVAWGLTGCLATFLIPAALMQIVMCSLFTERHSVYTNIAEKLDSLLPCDRTLLVLVGDDALHSEAVQFASHLQPANTFEWSFQLNEPWARILPMPLEEIIEQYLSSPPDAIVTTHEFVALTNSDREPYVSRGDLRLLRALNKRFRYKVVEEQGRFIIALLQRHG